jgi:hypothetical protein
MGYRVEDRQWTSAEREAIECWMETLRSYGSPVAIYVLFNDLIDASFKTDMVLRYRISRAEQLMDWKFGRAAW